MFIKLTIWEIAKNRQGATTEKDVFLYVNVASIESIFALQEGGKNRSRIVFTTSPENYCDVKETPEEIMVLIENLR